MIDKPIKQIAEADIQALIDNKVPESKTLDYKEAAIGNSDKDKRDFLADVVAFANTSGGDLILGVAEKRDDSNLPTGYPNVICGLGALNEDDEIRRLDAMIRTGIAPRVEVSHKRISTTVGDVWIVRVPQSWNSPHQITAQNASRFYARQNRNNYIMDVEQIREAFRRSESTVDRIRTLRQHRIDTIVKGHSPMQGLINPTIVTHVISIKSAGSPLIDAARIRQAYESKHFQTNNNLRRVNLDGCYCGWSPTRGIPKRYSHLFRHGFVEIVNGEVAEMSGPQTLLPIANIHNTLFHGISWAFQVLSLVEIGTPYIIGISVLNVSNRYVPSSQSSMFDPSGVGYIDRTNVVLPEIVVDSTPMDPPSISKLMRGTLDELWQSAGYSECPYFNEQGDYSPPDRRL
jgi:hypothetical protein